MSELVRESHPRVAIPKARLVVDALPNSYRDLLSREISSGVFIGKVSVGHNPKNQFFPAVDSWHKAQFEALENINWSSARYAVLCLGALTY